MSHLVHLNTAISRRRNCITTRRELAERETKASYLETDKKMTFLLLTQLLSGAPDIYPGNAKRLAVVIARRRIRALLACAHLYHRLRLHFSYSATTSRGDLRSLHAYCSPYYYNDVTINYRYAG